MILIDGPEIADIGAYRIEICSSIQISYYEEITACFDFDLTVVPKDFAFEYKLEDISVKVGQTLLYDLGMKFDGPYEHYHLILDVELHKAEKFVTFGSIGTALL